MINPISNKVLTWTCVTTYFIVWVAILSAGFKDAELLPALAIALTYALAHYYEMMFRNHLALSADATAIPLAIAVTVIGSGIAYFSGYSPRKIISFDMWLPMAFLAGHIVVLSAAWILNKFKIGGPAD